MEIDPALQSLVAELGHHVGLEELALDAEGFAALRFGDALVVNLQAVADEEALLLYVDMGPSQSGEQLYGALLRANLFWRSTFGATLSLSGDSPAHVVLAREFPWRATTLADFVPLLERFVATAQDWTELVQAPLEEADTESRTDEPDEQEMLAV